MAGVYYHADPLEQLELASHQHQQSQSHKKQRQRQTRIPEHLKAVKKASNNGKNMSAKPSKTSSGTAASSPRKNGGSTSQPAPAAAAARAGSEYSSTKNKLEQVIEAAAANNSHPDSRTGFLDDGTEPPFLLGSPIKERPSSVARPSTVNSARTVGSASNISRAPSQLSIVSAPAASQSVQPFQFGADHAQLFQTRYASPEKLPYAQDMNGSMETRPYVQTQYQLHQPLFVQTQQPQHYQPEYQAQYPYLPPSTTSPNAQASSPFAHTATYHQDASANGVVNGRARTISASTGSISAAPMGRVYGMSSTGAKTVASSSAAAGHARKLSTSSSSSSNRSSVLAGSHASKVRATGSPYSPHSPDVAAPPLKRRNTGSTNTSFSSGSAPTKSLSGGFPSSVSMSTGMSSTMSNLTFTSSSANGFPGGVGNSPKTPISAGPGGAGMTLSISMGGKACITTPRTELQGFDLGSGPQQAMPSDGKSDGQLKRPAEMVRSSSQANLSSVVGRMSRPAAFMPPSLIRSNTLDSHYFAQIQQKQPPSAAVPFYEEAAASSSQEQAASRSVELPSARAFGSASMQQSKTAAPYYPEKAQMQTSWKFPLTTSPGSGSGIGLGVTSNGDASPSVTPVTSPTASNQFIQSNTNGEAAAMPAAQRPKTEAEIRAASIQAWLDSPDEDTSDDSMEQDVPLHAVPSLVENLSVVPSDIMLSGSSNSNSSLDLAIHLTMDKVKRVSDKPEAGETVKTLSMSYDDQEDQPDVAGGFRVSGKSVRPLEMTKKRREGADDVAGHSRLGSPLPSASSRASSPRKGARELSPVKVQSSPAKSSTGTGVPKKERISNSRAELKNGKFSLGCGCGPKDDRKTMVQCDGCDDWYHLHCLGLRSNAQELTDDTWYCSTCDLRRKDERDAAQEAAVQVATSGEESYPSPDSPAKQSLDLANPPSFLRGPEAPSTPKVAPSVREPTFSHSATPKAGFTRSFEDAHLVPAPLAQGRILPTTPQQPSSASSQHTSSWHSGHDRSHSLSRQYAPVTPRLGGLTSSAFTPAPTVLRRSSGAGHEGLWANYAPSTPSNAGTAAQAHGRRLSKHFRTPSGMAAAAFHWEELGAPSSSSSFSSRSSSYHPKAGGIGLLGAGMDEDTEKARQWGLFYSGGLVPAASASAALQAQTLLGDPLMQHGPAFGGHGHAPHHHPATDFLPPLDQEEAARQRFLELNSTPKRYHDPQRFPTLMWD